MDKFTQFAQKIEKTAKFMIFRPFLKKTYFSMKIQIVGSRRIIVQKEREKVH